MSRRSLGVFFLLLVGSCTLSEPEEDWGLEICNRSDRSLFIRLGYRDPDAGRSERMHRLPPQTSLLVGVTNDTWEALARRVGSLTIDFCDEVNRESFEQRVVTENDLKSADWRVLYPKP